MTIGLLRLVLLVLGAWLGLAAANAAPARLPPLGASDFVLSALSILSVGILGATFAPKEQTRNLAVLSGWALCLGAAALIGPGVAARLS